MDQTRLLKLFVGTLLMSYGVGCGSYDGDAEVDEDYTELSQALSQTNEDCEAPHPDGPPVDRTFLNTFPAPAGFVSPSSYGSPQCGGAYITNLEAATGVVTAGRTKNFDEIVPASMPTTQAECQKYRLGVLSWNIDTATPEYEGGEWKFGSWVNGVCKLSILPKVTASSRFRIGASLRRHSVAGNTGSSYQLKSMRYRRSSVTLID